MNREKLKQLFNTSSNTEIGFGDILSALFHPIEIMIGKKKCSDCSVRIVILNLHKKIGAKKVIELIIRSFNEPPEKIAQEITNILKEASDDSSERR